MQFQTKQTTPADDKKFPRTNSFILLPGICENESGSSTDYSLELADSTLSFMTCVLSIFSAFSLPLPYDQTANACRAKQNPWKEPAPRSIIFQNEKRLRMRKKASDKKKSQKIEKCFEEFSYIFMQRGFEITYTNTRMSKLSCETYRQQTRKKRTHFFSARVTGNCMDGKNVQCTPSRTAKKTTGPCLLRKSETKAESSRVCCATVVVHSNTRFLNPPFHKSTSRYQTHEVSEKKSQDAHKFPCRFIDTNSGTAKKVTEKLTMNYSSLNI